jgi:hypothetical protein
MIGIMLAQESVWVTFGFLVELSNLFFAQQLI